MTNSEMAVVTQIIAAKDIKPKVPGKSDFFSWQLFRWARKYPDYLQVLRGTRSVFGNNPTLYIGRTTEHASWFHGARLNGIIGHGAKIEAFAFGPEFDTENWTDTTDAWWPEYLRIGVCAIHDWSHDWIESGDIRTCQRCGKQERRHVEMVKRVVWR